MIRSCIKRKTLLQPSVISITNGIFSHAQFTWKTPVSSLILKITLHQWWGHNVTIVPPLNSRTCYLGSLNSIPRGVQTSWITFNTPNEFSPFQRALPKKVSHPLCCVIYFVVCETKLVRVLLIWAALT